MSLLKVTVVSGSRSDYGPLRNILFELNKSEKLNLKIVLTGSHLDCDFGETASEVEQDGFVIDRRININTEIADSTSNAKSMSRALSEFADYFSVSKPDLVLGLGDRFELFAIATAAVSMGIPFGHIGGGDITVGAIDDFWRHGLTKLSTFHFPALAAHADRIAQMGEDPDKIEVIGEPAIQNIHSINLIDERDLLKEFNWTKSCQIIVTYHPETNLAITPEEQFSIVLQALDAHKESNVLFTYANCDNGGWRINEMIEEAVKDRENWLVIKSLGNVRYLSCLNCFDVVVGNSSSALIETPSFNIPSVDIGGRQEGRVAPSNVIHCELQKESIINALNTALDDKFRDQLEGMENPYLCEGGSQKLRVFLESLTKDDLIKKPFIQLSAQ